MKLLVFLFVLSVAQAMAEDNIISEKYTKEELAKLKKFHEMTTSMTDKEYMKTDGYLIRWLKASEWNLDAAKNMLGNSMKWRAENNINTISQEDLGQGNGGNSFYSIMDAVDKFGRPVIQVEMKKMDTRKYAVGANGKLFARIWLQVFERMEEKIHKTELSSGKDLGQGFAIMDLTDYNLRQHACIACIPMYLDMVRSFERQYPGLFGKMILVNAPRIFSPLFELMKPVMSSQTREAVTLFGSNKGEWQPKLHELISPDQLPIRLGGTQKKI